MIEKVLFIILAFSVCLFCVISGCTVLSTNSIQTNPLPTADGVRTVTTNTPLYQTTISSVTPELTSSIIKTPTPAPSQKIKSVPDFKRIDLIHGIWQLDTTNNYVIFMIKDDDEHHVNLTVIPKYYDNTLPTSIIGKIIQISDNNFQMSFGSDRSKTGLQNQAMMDLSNIIWRYDHSTGELVTNVGDRASYIDEINWNDYQPLSYSSYGYQYSSYSPYSYTPAIGQLDPIGFTCYPPAPNLCLGKCWYNCNQGTMFVCTEQGGVCQSTPYDQRQYITPTGTQEVCYRADPSSPEVCRIVNLDNNDNTMQPRNSGSGGDTRQYITPNNGNSDNTMQPRNSGSGGDTRQYITPNNGNSDNTMQPRNSGS